MSFFFFCKSLVLEMVIKLSQLELLQRLENHKLKKLQALQNDLNLISQMKENLKERPCLGQKRKM
jgi:hypothetical protein